MEIQLKNKIQIPKNAWTLYLKLFSERFGEKPKYTEVIKSWRSLSDSEKVLFCNKCKDIKKGHLTNYLKKAKPYLKEKNADAGRNEQIVKYVKQDEPFLNEKDSVEKSQEHVTETDSHACIQEESFTMEIQESKNDDLSACISNDIVMNNIDDSRTYTQDIQNTTNIQHQNHLLTEPLPPSLRTYTQDIQNTTNIQHQNHLLTEPLPPSLRSGKDLFEMLKHEKGNKWDSWTSLPRLQKYQYNFVVLKLKKEYIQKYREYLDSLTQRELFDHYNKVF